MFIQEMIKIQREKKQEKFNKEMLLVQQAKREYPPGFDSGYFYCPYIPVEVLDNVVKVQNVKDELNYDYAMALVKETI